MNETHRQDVQKSNSWFKRRTTLELARVRRAYGVCAVLVGTALLITAFGGQVNPDANHVDYWCTEEGQKWDDLSGSSFEVPSGQSWTLLVLKAGQTNYTWTTPVVGAKYSPGDDPNGGSVLRMSGIAARIRQLSHEPDDDRSPHAYRSSGEPRAYH